jgi:ribulose-phosphate 3-epimerase
MATCDTVQKLRQAAPLITAGVLAADVLNLGRELQRVQEAGVRLLHFDVMDGRFCPALTFGPAFVKGVKTGLLKDVHLMIAEPIDRLRDYVQAGADIVAINIETTVHIHRALQLLGEMENANDPARGLVRGVVLNPGTPLEALAPLLGQLEAVYLLAVNPGAPGQGFIPETKARLARLKALVKKSQRDILVGVDGGVTRENIAEIAALGPDIIVAGTAVFKGDPLANARRLIEAAQQAAGRAGP